MRGHGFVHVLLLVITRGLRLLAKKIVVLYSVKFIFLRFSRTCIFFFFCPLTRIFVPDCAQVRVVPSGNNDDSGNGTTLKVRFTGTAKGMADEVVDARDTIKRNEGSLRLKKVRAILASFILIAGACVQWLKSDML